MDYRVYVWDAYGYPIVPDSVIYDIPLDSLRSPTLNVGKRSPTLRDFAEEMRDIKRMEIIRTEQEQRRHAHLEACFNKAVNVYNNEFPPMS